jgi:hypothetical protein
MNLKNAKKQHSFYSSFKAIHPSLLINSSFLRTSATS